MAGVLEYRRLFKQFERLEKLKKGSKNKERLTANQQLLILHYLGFLDSHPFPTVEKKHFLFHLLIDKNRQAVKEFLIYRNGKHPDSFNPKDLKIVHDILVECGLSEIVDKIKSDLVKYDKKKK
jgi:hypothetical protein